MGEFDDIVTPDEKENQEDSVYACGEYLDQLCQMRQVEYYSGFWHTVLKWLTLTQDITIFRHMKNKYAYIDISICDLIWMIFLCAFVLGLAGSFGTYYVAKRNFEATHCKVHEIPRYYNDTHHMLPTEHPDYIRQINDIVPCIEYERILKYKLNKRFPTSTNYYQVVKRDGYCYYNEVSDEEFEKALKKFKREKYTAEAHQRLLEQRKKKKENRK